MQFCVTLNAFIMVNKMTLLELKGVVDDLVEKIGEEGAEYYYLSDDYPPHYVEVSLYESDYLGHKMIIIEIETE